MTDSNQAKRALWRNFLTTHRVDVDSVPLFDANNGTVVTMPYGRDGRLILKRSLAMDDLMRKLGGELIQQFRDGPVTHDGILYLMFRWESNAVIPLYFGKAEIYGKELFCTGTRC
jgi:hypothetical protein